MRTRVRMRGKRVLTSLCADKTVNDSRCNDNFNKLSRGTRPIREIAVSPFLEHRLHADLLPGDLARSLSLLR